MAKRALAVDKLIKEAEPRRRIGVSNLTGAARSEWDRLVELYHSGNLLGYKKTVLYQIAKKACGLTISYKSFCESLEQAVNDE